MAIKSLIKMLKSEISAKLTVSGFKIRTVIYLLYVLYILILYPSHYVCVYVCVFVCLYESFSHGQLGTRN